MVKLKCSPWAFHMFELILICILSATKSNWRGLLAHLQLTKKVVEKDCRKRRPKFLLQDHKTLGNELIRKVVFLGQ